MTELRRKQPKLGSSAFMQVPRTQQQVHKIPNPASIPNLSQLDASGSPATGSGLPRGLYNYGNNNPFQQMPKEEIKNEPGDSPSHVPSNQYQLQPGQGLLNPQRISPAPDRSPSTMTPSPGIAGSMSPHDQGSITPTPPYNNMSNAPMNPFANFVNFGNTLVTNPPQQQQQQQHLPPQTIAPIFDTNLPGPSNGWVQPIPTTGGSGLNPPQSFNLGNFGSISFSSDPMLGSLISGSNQMNVGPPSMGSDLMNLDLGNLPSNFNSAELRSVLDGLSTTELNRLEQIAGQVANNQAAGNAQQQSSTSQQQALKAFLATQQHPTQPPLPGAHEPLPDRHDNDEDLTDSFKNLSTNDLN
ncbi:AGAP009515-PA-like protein [Anopheles sinensis]|uniref:AGAP009515-PA-like protein n=1 Tax=Anopheles sinensis TaxID=74873 RepID=A0A084VPF6_ANOSI|nr:AGAP009515-PA-like protein [Anopheles sinensis]